MQKEYDIIERTIISGIILILNKHDFNNFVQDYNLPIFNINLKQFTLYNGAMIYQDYEE